MGEYSKKSTLSSAGLGGGQRLNGRFLALLLGFVLLLGTLIAPLVRASDITYYPPLVLPAPLRTSFEIDRQDTALDKDLHPNNQREIVGSSTTLRARYVSADERFHTFFAMSDESLNENHFVRKNYGENRRNEFHVGSIIALGKWPLETEIGLIRREDIFFDGVGGRIAQHYGFHWRKWQGTASVGIDYMQEESLRRLVDSFSTIGYSRESLRSTLASQVRYSGGVVFMRPGRRFSFIQGIEAHETPFFDIPPGIHENLGSPALESSYHLRTIWHVFGIESHGDIRDLHPFASFQRTAHETTIGVGLVVQ